MIFNSPFALLFSSLALKEKGNCNCLARTIVILLIGYTFVVLIVVLHDRHSMSYKSCLVRLMAKLLFMNRLILRKLLGTDFAYISNIVEFSDYFVTNTVLTHLLRCSHQCMRSTEITVDLLLHQCNHLYYKFPWNLNYIKLDT